MHFTVSKKSRPSLSVEFKKKKKKVKRDISASVTILYLQFKKVAIMYR